MKKEEFIKITDTLWGKHSSQDYNCNMTITEHNYDYLIEELVEKLIISGVGISQALSLHNVSQQRELFYNFITWYNAKPKAEKPKDGIIRTNIIEEYLKFSGLFKGKTTKKMLEAEQFIDEYKDKNNTPPTYEELRVFLGVASTNTAYYRVLHCRHKMK